MKYSALSPPELFTVCAREGDAAAWQEFIHRFNPLIARSVLRVAIRHGSADRGLIDDLVQETYLKICKNQCRLLRTFVPQRPESAFGFLKVVAASVANDFFKSRLAERRRPESGADSLEEVCPPTVPPLSSRNLNHAERAVLIRQIDNKLKEILPANELQRSRTVFWLYYRSGFTANAIASLPTFDLSTKGVESLLFRLTSLVRESLSEGFEAEGKKGFRQAESF